MPLAWRLLWEAFGWPLAAFAEWKTGSLLEKEVRWARVGLDGLEAWRPWGWQARGPACPRARPCRPVALPALAAHARAARPALHPPQENITVSPR